MTKSIDTIYKQLKLMRKLLTIAEETEIKAVRAKYGTIKEILKDVDEKVTTLRLKA